jgi:hypothetical protein
MRRPLLQPRLPGRRRNRLRRRRRRKRSALSRYGRISQVPPSRPPICPQAKRLRCDRQALSQRRPMRMGRSRSSPHRAIRRPPQRPVRVPLRPIRYRSISRLRTKLPLLRRSHPVGVTRCSFHRKAAKRKHGPPSVPCKRSTPTCWAGVNRSCAAPTWAKKASTTARWLVRSRQGSRPRTCARILKPPAATASFRRIDEELSSVGGRIGREQRACITDAPPL